MDARANACVASFLECAGCSIALDEFTFANAEDESVRIVHQGSNTQIFVTGYDKPVAQFLVGAFAHIDKYISRETFEEIREWTRESFLTAKKVSTSIVVHAFSNYILIVHFFLFFLADSDSFAQV